MTATTPTEMFERELQKLYHAEFKIPDLHADLAGAASEQVAALFTGHEEETFEQIHRLKRMFEALGEPPHAEGNPVMEGIFAGMDELISTEAADDLRDLAC